MTIRNGVSVFTDETSEQRTTQKGKTSSEANEARGEAFDVAVSGEVEYGTDTNAVEALDNNANNLSLTLFRKHRASRYANRYKLWKLSSLPRVRDCGRVSVSDFPGINLREGKATYQGLATCGSVWACPVCNSKIMTSRSADVKKAIDVWSGAGKTFAFQTLTMRHHKGQSLDELWKGLSFAWQRLNSGATAKQEVAKYGQAGFIRVVEITYGSNGWHIHIHILRFLERALTDYERGNWAEAQFQRWSKALTSKGFAEPLRAAQDFKLTNNADDLAKYMTKQGNFGGKLSMEITSQATKKAKLGGRKPFDILEDYIADPTGKDKDLWNEYEQASNGKKQTHWSNGLRDLLGIDYKVPVDEVEVDEYEFYDEGLARLPDVVLENTGIAILNSRSGRQATALDLAEQSGLTGLYKYLDELGVKHQTPEEAWGDTDELEHYFMYKQLLHDYRQH